MGALHVPQSYSLKAKDPTEIMYGSLNIHDPVLTYSLFLSDGIISLHLSGWYNLLLFSHTAVPSPTVPDTDSKI
jgi:hypothetical protein